MLNKDDVALYRGEFLGNLSYLCLIVWIFFVGHLGIQHLVTSPKHLLLNYPFCKFCIGW